MGGHDGRAGRGRRARARRGGVGLLTESLGGLYWLPAAVAVGLLGGLTNAWVLLVEILR